MNREIFKEKFVAEIKIAFPENNVTEDTVRKNNQTLKGITINQKSGVSPTIYPDEYYAKLENGFSFEEIIEKAIAAIKNAITTSPITSAEELADYGTMKTKLFPRLFAIKGNEKMLEKLVYEAVEDLAIVYCIDFGNFATAKITKELMDAWGVDLDTIKKDAAESAPIIRPAEMKGLTEIMMEVSPMMAEMMGPYDPRTEVAFVVTNETRNLGASVITYPGLLKGTSEFFVKNGHSADFYILPSSIHEAILLPKRKDMDDPEALRNMVEEINGNELAPCDKLSDSVYLYTAATGSFTLA